MSKVITPVSKKSQPTVVLASASAIRREILHKAGVEFTVSPSGVDEARIKDQYVKLGKPAAQLALRLAHEKAKTTQTLNYNLVIGADQVLEFKGKIFDKPQSLAETKARLLELRGQEHKLIGAVCIVQNGELVWEHISVSKLKMRNFSDQFLDDYLQREGKGVLACVGGYKYEALGAQLFERVQGDFYAVLGLPLLPLLSELRARGALLK